jgi:transposase-like protein
MKEKGCPKTLVEAVRYFADPRIAHDFVASIRWPDGVVKCPRCEASEGLAFLENQLRWTCKQCRTAKRKWQFSVKVRTIMEDSPIGIDKWLCAMWLIVSAKNGISSYELHRSLGITQKTAWFLSHRMRLALHVGSIEKLKGQVEADETFIGARARNMHANKKRRSMYGTSIMKTAVLGLLERNSPEKPSRVKLKVVESVRRHDLDPEIRKHVEKGSEVHTDKLRSYENLDDEYVHQVIDHAECYARGHVHTDRLENFWSLLKRGIRGTYVNVEPFHLFRYLDEQAFRFNERKGTDADRFLAALPSIVGRRLTYKGLTGNVATATT